MTILESVSAKAFLGVSTTHNGAVVVLTIQREQELELLCLRYTISIEHRPIDPFALHWTGLSLRRFSHLEATVLLSAALYRSRLQFWMPFRA
jgi:hypothetical protein